VGSGSKIGAGLSVTRTDPDFIGAVSGDPEQHCCSFDDTHKSFHKPYLARNVSSPGNSLRRKAPVSCMPRRLVQRGRGTSSSSVDFPTHSPAVLRQSTNPTLRSASVPAPRSPSTQRSRSKCLCCGDFCFIGSAGGDRLLAIKWLALGELTWKLQLPTTTQLSSPMVESYS
jgi:hypothetical protein